MAVGSGFICVALDKVVLWNLKNDSEKCQKLMDNLGMNVPRKMFNLWAMGADDVRMWAFELGNELGDVVYLSVVKDTWLNFLHIGLLVNAIDI